MQDKECVYLSRMEVTYPAISSFSFSLKHLISNNERGQLNTWWLWMGAPEAWCTLVARPHLSWGRGWQSWWSRLWRCSPLHCYWRSVEAGPRAPPGENISSKAPPKTNLPVSAAQTQSSTWGMGIFLLPTQSTWFQGSRHHFWHHIREPSGDQSAQEPCMAGIQRLLSLQYCPPAVQRCQSRRAWLPPICQAGCCWASHRDAWSSASLSSSWGLSLYPQWSFLR